MKHKVFAWFESNSDAQNAIATLEKDESDVVFLEHEHGNYINNELSLHETSVWRQMMIGAGLGAAAVGILTVVAGWLGILHETITASAVLGGMMGALIGAMLGFIAGASAADPRLRNLARKAGPDAVLVTALSDSFATTRQVVRVFRRCGARETSRPLI